MQRVFDSGAGPASWQCSVVSTESTAEAPAGPAGAHKQLQEDASAAAGADQDQKWADAAGSATVKHQQQEGHRADLKSAASGALQDKRRQQSNAAAEERSRCGQQGCMASTNSQTPGPTLGTCLACTNCHLLVTLDLGSHLGMHTSLSVSFISCHCVLYEQCLLHSGTFPALQRQPQQQSSAPAGDSQTPTAQQHQDASAGSQQQLVTLESELPQFVQEFDDRVFTREHAFTLVGCWCAGVAALTNRGVRLGRGLAHWAEGRGV